MQRAGRLIGKLKLPKGADGAEERACAAWNIAAGKKVAKHTRASRLVRTTLIIEVGDIVWQRQLNTLRNPLLRNLEELLGEGIVTDLDFRPMPARMGPAQATSANPSIHYPGDLGGLIITANGAVSAGHAYDSKKRLNEAGQPAAEFDDASLIRDPVMAMLYRQARNKRRA